jgi:hypothetical protein
MPFRDESLGAPPESGEPEQHDVTQPWRPEADPSTDPAARRASGEARHRDGQQAEPAFRIGRPRHLRDEFPTLPLPALRDTWAGASTTFDQTMAADPEAVPRRPARRRAWLAAAATVVAVGGAASFALWGQPSTAVRGTDLAVPGTDRALPWPAGTNPTTTDPAITDPTTTDPDAANLPTSDPDATDHAAHATAAPPGTPGPNWSAMPTPTTAAAPLSIAAPVTMPAPAPTVAPTTTPPAPTTPPVDPSKIPVTPHIGTIIANSGNCLDNWSKITAEGNPMQVFSCNGTIAQKITFGADDTLGMAGKCIRPAGRSPGALVALRDCDESTSQWSFRSDNAIVHTASGLCLTDSGVLTNGLPQTTISVCTAAASQRWTIT